MTGSERVLNYSKQEKHGGMERGGKESPGCSQGLSSIQWLLFPCLPAGHSPHAQNSFLCFGCGAVFHPLLGNGSVTLLVLAGNFSELVTPQGAITCSWHILLFILPSATSLQPQSPTTKFPME